MKEEVPVTFEKQSRQGDVLIDRFEGALPEGVKKAEPQEGVYIVAHSETGHHHVVDMEGVEFYDDPVDKLVSYLVTTKDVVLRHLRSFNTHKPQMFKGGGIYKITKQRQATLTGWERAAD